MANCLRSSVKTGKKKTWLRSRKKRGGGEGGAHKGVLPWEKSGGRQLNVPRPSTVRKTGGVWRFFKSLGSLGGGDSRRANGKKKKKRGGGRSGEGGKKGKKKADPSDLQ